MGARVLDGTVGVRVRVRVRVRIRQCVVWDGGGALSRSCRSWSWSRSAVGKYKTTPIRDSIILDAFPTKCKNEKNVIKTYNFIVL